MFSSLESRVQFTAALAVALPFAVAVWAIFTGEVSFKLRWTLLAFMVLAAGFLLVQIREQVVSPLRTLANLLEAMREGDYSIRARTTKSGSPLDEVHEQINAMGATLQQQRLGAVEATALLRKVMEEINVAIFAFDYLGRVRLANKAAADLMRRPLERLEGSSAKDLGLDDFLSGQSQTLTRSFPGGSGRWGISTSSFREGGVPHQLLVLTDLTRPLREEELQAWQRIVRVLGHELNNSLAPIKSIAGSLHSLLERDPLPEDWREDMLHGLQIVASRSESLQRFLNAYTRLAKLPRPNLQPTPISPIVARAAELERRESVRVLPGPDVATDADADQIEQALINLIKNAVEAGPPVEVSWQLAPIAGGQHLHILVRDHGPGLSNTANLFVPFFTTKPGGSGIGLVLCRQIAEAHGGTLELRNVEGGPGCLARLALPLAYHVDLPPSRL
ncbi:MAG: ATP-binding protein [Bryobacter sp.]|nr:ATP-binding protein [Bryobacter sp.]